jgi:hypothetical protein
VEGLGNGFFSTQLGDDGNQSTEVGEKFLARTADWEMKEGDVIPRFQPEASESWTGKIR